MSNTATHTSKTKLRKVKYAAGRGVVMLAETRWDQVTPMLLMQDIGGSRVVSAPSIITEAGGRSGGVAMIIPSHWYPGTVTSRVIVPGYVLQVSRAYQSITHHWVVAYLRPGEEESILAAWDAGWQSDPPVGPLLIAGDFNKFAVSLPAKLEEFKASFSLQELEMHGPTHRPPKGQPRQLDKWLIRDQSVTIGAIMTRPSIGKLPADALIFICQCPVRRFGGSRVVVLGWGRFRFLYLDFS